MKILLVSMPCLHFFRWAEQLRDAGYEVYWFDITDGGKKVDRLHWVKQIVGWKFRWDYPGRVFVKINFPKLYRFIQGINERNTVKIFEQKLLEIQPDIVHSFELQISCIPILPIMLKYKNVKWIYSSWGSDVYYFEKLNIEENTFRQIMQRIDFLISDCNRDYEIAKKMGFKNQFLGVFPGNGGIDFPIEPSQLIEPKNRDTIVIKAYNEGVGRGIEILKSFDSKLINLLMKFNIVLFGANQEIFDFIEKNAQLKKLNLTIYSKDKHIPNDILLRIMNKGYLYIANSLSDGLPNALLEAMGMGCFPIQSNPGNVMTEIIQHGENGFLINDCLDNTEINHWITLALIDKGLIEKGFHNSVERIRIRCNRETLKNNIVKIYQEVFEN
ncbi:glycosyltransferase [Flavobacterium ranwuense]|uniref:Glycosyltransferase n=1 Tax=Flavobacterium ranwuense TaxID=2541725 RepID=A0ABY2DQ67_9FLAO|nr:glycosyltransferase [Flavobacterium ranwuense]TDE28043.1 glycosyltransferase [Flavobacterium ranwuense]